MALRRTIIFQLVTTATLIWSSIGLAQSSEINNSSLSLQYGFSLKATLELSKHPVLHVSASSGVGSLFAITELYPSVNAELQFYSSGLGTRRPDIKSPGMNLDFILAFTMTAGTENLLRDINQSEIADRAVPLYYFSNFTMPSLINPYDNSISLGTNLIWSNDKARHFQRVGFLNLHPFREFQISYFNDGGPPVSNLGLGDKKDRYYTGGVNISYHDERSAAVNLIELTFFKFTGYSKSSYEVAGHLQQAYVRYIEEDQGLFNRSLWSVTVANPYNHWGVSINDYNRTAIDLQHGIHLGGYSPFHLVSGPNYLGVSGKTYFVKNNIGLR